MIKVHILEFHITHFCNLACNNCSHYSDYGHKGIVTFEDAEEQMKEWSKYLEPKTLKILGGEPTIHPKLPEIVKMAREYFKNSVVEIVTNGFFLHKHPTLPEIIKQDDMIKLGLSMHHDGEEYVSKMKPILALIESWKTEYKIELAVYGSYTYWHRQYKGYGEDMQPYEDGKPDQSWVRCGSKYCLQLLENKIYKCPQLAYLNMQNDKYRLSEKWSKYLAYKPLTPESSKEEKVEFFTRDVEDVCGMCPANPEVFKLPSPIRMKKEKPI